MDKATVRSEKSTNGRSSGAISVLRRGLDLTARLSPNLAATVAARLFVSPRRYKRPTREVALLERAQALPREEGFALPFARKREGEGRGVFAAWRWGSGPPVLLVHGWEGRGAQLGSVIDPLVSAGLSVVAFDAPAHGSSPGSTATLVDFEGAIRALGHRFGPFAGVIAHSFGGPATLIALDRGLQTSNVVMIAPPATLRRGLDYFSRLFDLSGEVRDTMTRQIGERVGLSFEEVEPLPRARRQRVPLLVVHDRDDAEVPVADGRALADAWPGGALRITDGLGHRKILRDPVVVRTITDFVAGFQPERPAIMALERALDLDRFAI